MGVHFCSDRRDIVYSHEYRNSEQFTTKYTFSEIIGRGCYSKVKLAYDNMTHKKVAVKILEKAQVLKNNLYCEVKREKQILLQIQSNPNRSFPLIVPLIQCCQDFEHLYFVMEYASRGNLRQLLKQKKTLQMSNIKFITVCILLALKQLERQGIIHGDIKPQNILIDEDGYFLLGDFSSAQYFNCWSHEIRGTKGYIAPQIKRYQKFKLKDNKIDLYSLGALLWELAHGTKYQNYLKNHKSLVKDNQLTGDSSDDSQDIPFIDPVFEQFVAQLLKQNPFYRPTIQSLWTHSWLNLQKHQLDLYLHKKVPTHPFQPLDLYFQHSKSNANDYSPKSKKNLYDQTDSLLSSVLISQKRYQNLFASFSTGESDKRKSKKIEF